MSPRPCVEVAAVRRGSRFFWQSRGLGRGAFILGGRLLAGILLSSVPRDRVGLLFHMRGRHRSLYWINCRNAIHFAERIEIK